MTQAEYLRIARETFATTLEEIGRVAWRDLEPVVREAHGDVGTSRVEIERVVGTAAARWIRAAAEEFEMLLVTNAEVDDEQRR